MTLAAVSEQEAVGETAALFAEIRRALGVPVVNLVWRHLATLPGGLPWAWSVVGPFYRGGAAAREGAALLAALPLSAVTPWSREMLLAAAGDGAGARAIVAVLDSYNRSNAINLVVLTALALRLRHPGPLPAAPPAADAAPGPAAVEGSLPPPLTVAAMDPETAELVGRLDRLGEREEGRIPATMYRHLAHWPGFLPLALALLEPLDRDGRLTALRDDARARASAAALRIVAGLAAPGPAPASRAAVLAALDVFTGGVIARMTPICALLRRAVPPGVTGRGAEPDP